MDEAAQITRLLARLRVAGAVLVKDETRRDFALAPNGDRRRRPSMRVSAALVQGLLADGALTALEADGRFALSHAGHARALRARAGADDQFRAQHDAIVPRAVMDADGDVRTARGVDPSAPLARLEKLTDAKGRPYFSANEIAAARTLRADWDAGQGGLVRGSDWSAPPRGSTSRANGAEMARAGAVDARRRVERALGSLAPILAEAVRAACLREEGLEAIERANAWPVRAGKLALKCALAQLAQIHRR